MDEREILIGIALSAFVLLFIAACSNSNDKGTAAQQAGNQAGQGMAQATGQAVSTPNVKCNQDSDCGEQIIGEPYCFQGNVLTPKNIPMCIYPGTVNSYCKTEKKDDIQLCVKSRESCSHGRCLIISKQPCSDTDGGRDYNESGTVKDGFYMTYVDNCQDDRWLMERYCSNGDKGEGLTEMERCQYGCSNGRCITEKEADEDEDSSSDDGSS